MSTLPKDGGPAFPARRLTETPGEFYPGMSLRDYFAGQALAGGARVLAMDHGNDTPSGLAREAYIIADAMLAARTEAK